MVGYEPTIHRSAKRELEQLPSDDKDRLTGVIADVAQERQPSGHEKAEALEGQPGLFRVRVGDYRAVLELSKPELQVIAVGHRSSVYDCVDSLDERRVTA